MVSRQKVVEILSPKFPTPAVEKLLVHYEGTANAFSRANWEDTLSEAGKFTESALRCLRYITTGELVDDIDVGREVDRLQQMPKATAEETVRLLMPRALRAVYQTASDRGARHDRLSFDPNPMDATLAVHVVSWVLAEFIRFCHPGTIDPGEAQKLVATIVEPKFPIVEEVDGLTFLHKDKVSARDAILVKLRLTLGGRVRREQLFDTARNHNHSLDNARATLSQLRKARLIHENHEGIRLLAPGVQEADRILKNGQA